MTPENKALIERVMTAKEHTFFDKLSMIGDCTLDALLTAARAEERERVRAIAAGYIPDHYLETFFERIRAQSQGVQDER